MKLPKPLTDKLASDIIQAAVHSSSPEMLGMSAPQHSRLKASLPERPSLGLFLRCVRALGLKIMVAESTDRSVEA